MNSKQTEKVYDAMRSLDAALTPSTILGDEDYNDLRAALDILRRVWTRKAAGNVHVRVVS